VLLVAVAALSATASAQDTGSVEVGTSLGITVSVPDDGEAEVFFALPGGGSLFATPTVYATFFVARAWMVEPQIGFDWNSVSEEVTFSGIFQLGYLFKPAATGSLYGGVNVGWFTLGSDPSSGAVGVAAGYRIRIGKAVATRIELRYRRWLGDAFDLNEVTVAATLGAVLP
jgi:hypothetical protein